MKDKLTYATQFFVFSFIIGALSLFYIGTIGNGDEDIVFLIIFVFICSIVYLIYCLAKYILELGNEIENIKKQIKK